MDYNYYNKKAFLGLSLNFCEQQVVDLLGNPDKIEKEIYSKKDNESEIDITYIYKKYKIKIMFNYYKSALLGMSIFTKKMLIDNIDLFNLNKEEVLKKISKLSKVSIINALNDVINLKSYNSVEYKFNDINFMLWFEDDKLDEICIYSDVEKI